MRCDYGHRGAGFEEAGDFGFAYGPCANHKTASPREFKEHGEEGRGRFHGTILAELGVEGDSGIGGRTAWCVQRKSGGGAHNTKHFKRLASFSEPDQAHAKKERELVYFAWAHSSIR